MPIPKALMLIFYVWQIGSPLLMGPGASGALEPFPEMTGTASALLGKAIVFYLPEELLTLLFIGCWQYMFSASVGTLVLQWEIQSNMPLCLTQLIMSVMVILVLVFNKETLLRNLVYKTSDKDISASGNINTLSADMNGGLLEEGRGTNG